MSAFERTLKWRLMLYRTGATPWRVSLTIRCSTVSLLPLLSLAYFECSPVRGHDVQTWRRRSNRKHITAPREANPPSGHGLSVEINHVILRAETATVILSSFSVLYTYSL